MNNSTDEPVENGEQNVSPADVEPTQNETSPTQTHFEREDNRWFHSATWRDWWILLLLIMTYLVWTGIIYFLEPGIR